jgi:hypothetical protein
MDIDSFVNQAKLVFDRTIYKNDLVEISKLSTNMMKLEKAGLAKLNRTLVENSKNSVRNIWDFLAEHNLCSQLMDGIGEDIIVEYEPGRYKKPPDFVISNHDSIYFLQMKNLSDSERENRKSKVIEYIKKRCKEIPINRFISFRLDETFIMDEVDNLIEQIKGQADSNDGHKHYYPSKSNSKAVFSFHDPNILKLEHLTVGSVSDLNMVNITGEDREQIRGSLIKASGGFVREVDHLTINLAILEADNQSDIDISECVYGVEEFQHSSNRANTWRRDTTGFFNHPEYSELISGVIILRRFERTPISKYTTTLFMNDRYTHQIAKIREVITINHIINHFELPEH